MKKGKFIMLMMGVAGGMVWSLLPVHAASEPFIGEIMMTGANFCPRGWANTDGQLLPINQNQALFSLLGTTYGGDGRTTFALPDLRGRVPLHVGNGPGLTQRNQGEKGGKEKHALTQNEVPTNNASSGTSYEERFHPSDSANLWAVQGTGPDLRKPGVGPLVPRRGGSPTVSASGDPHHLMQPYLGIRFCIALQGIFPARN